MFLKQTEKILPVKDVVDTNVALLLLRLGLDTSIY